MVYLVRRVRARDLLFQVDDGWACFGLEVNRASRLVTRAGMGGFVGKNIDSVAFHYMKRGAKVIQVGR